MNRPVVSTPPAVTPDRPQRIDTRLRGSWLLLARSVWLAVAALSLSLFIAGVSADFVRLQVVCPTDFCASGQLPPAGLRALQDLGLSLGFFAAYSVALDGVFAAVYGAVAALIFWRQSAERFALFAALALLTFGTATFPSAMDALVAAHPAWRLPVASLHFLGSASFCLFLYLFPDGRFVPRWTRWVALAWLAWQLPKYWFPDRPDFNTWTTWLNIAFWSGALGTVVYAQVYRYRRVSNAVQRQQTKWVVFGIAMALMGFLGVNLTVFAIAPMPTSAGALATLMVGYALMYLALLLIPLSIGIAMLRYHLFDVDMLINRTLVYGALTASVVGIFVLIVGSLGALFQTRSSLLISLVATGLVAVLFQPLRDRLQRGVNRLMYGERDDPVTVLSRLGQRLESAIAPDAVLSTIVETVAQALKLLYAAIALKQGDEFKIRAEYSLTPYPRPLPPLLTLSVRRGGRGGEAGEGGEVLPLIYQSETVGQLILAPRAPGEDFSPADRRLLENIARQAGAAAHAVRLTADLQNSRERLVTAREEERRRLRRDLHDGLGPTLAGVTLKLDAALDLLSGDPETGAAPDPPAARALLLELKAQTQVTVAEIRRLVYELRPPALDELGLVSALREHVARYGGIADGLYISIDAPPQGLPPLSAAVEVAAYRIAMEAVTNVVRHARADSCLVRFAVDDALHVEIVDNGIGIQPNTPAGVGLTSMRERAAELGGTCVIERAPNGGTRVMAQLPISKA